MSFEFHHRNKKNPVIRNSPAPAVPMKRWPTCIGGESKSVNVSLRTSLDVNLTLHTASPPGGGSTYQPLILYKANH
ncbi:hypothetical protein BDN71DRAFT_1278738 [Pleurotus eryngii]|uniref:Uncharacterized protein n=1 Tax=Pleurotus eryngii TaxID=5323 RepID=A0A9P5ZU68_PLEER|nr:hypothetical protein BDN71DRAFT_1278738 [Pleurotus eryngii]